MPPMDVAFHVNIPVPWSRRSGYLCRLLSKAYEARARVWVVVAEDELVPLDEALWTLPSDDFVPHVRADTASPLLLQRSPIAIASPSIPVVGQRHVLVNAQASWLPVVEEPGCPFVRVIEVVSEDEAAKQAARQRWRRYLELGVRPVVHDRASRAMTTGMSP